MDPVQTCNRAVPRNGNGLRSPEMVPKIGPGVVSRSNVQMAVPNHPAVAPIKKNTGISPTVPETLYSKSSFSIHRRYYFLNFTVSEFNSNALKIMW